MVQNIKLKNVHVFMRTQLTKTFTYVKYGIYYIDTLTTVYHLENFIYLPP